MSDFFSDDPARPGRPGSPGTPGGQGGQGAGGQGGGEGDQATRSRRPGPLVLTIVVVAVALILFSIFVRIWTQKLWFTGIGFSSVFTTLIETKVVLFVVFGLLMALIVGGNLFLAFRLRPVFRPNSPEQANLERYREVITPLRRLVLVATALVFGIFAGASGSGQWRTYLLWSHRQSFGRADPYFHRDLGFFVFTLPWLHYLVDFVMTGIVLGLLAAVLVHYLYGGIRLQSVADKVSGSAQAQISGLLGLFVLVKAADYWLDRYDLTTSNGGLVTGMTYTRDHAVLPSKNILLFIAIICAVLFFANIVRRTWLLPGVGLALFALSAVLLGFVWPTIVQKFQVGPNAPDKEAAYIGKNIQATRSAFGLQDASVRNYDAQTTVTDQLRQSAQQQPVRLVDPQVVQQTFEQLQQVRGYYSVPAVLDIDRYLVNGQQRDLVVAARELHLEGLPDSQKNWANEHTVYTHGYGLVAAYGNQRGADNQSVDTDGQPVFAERDLPPQGELTDPTKGKNVGQIYFGESSPDYSIVGKAPGGKDIELDVPSSSSNETSRTDTYRGKTGVGIGGPFHKLLYAVKFGEPNILLSSRVNENSRILYDRSPRERVQKVAPWLTVDNDALPAVVDGRIKWILDGYTVSDRYPNAEKRSLAEMTSDAINPRAAYATLPTDQINYMRNSVKAVVDAYDGTVTLYAWDGSDPILKAWEGAFPGVVKAKSSIPSDLLAHMRYPEDLFKVQREMLARYHVLDPRTFYEGSDQWQVPSDPTENTATENRKQPPYRISLSESSGANQVFSLTSVYTPNNRKNLASFISVGADATDSSTYGKFSILRLPDDRQISGPSQVANQFRTDPKIADQVLPFTRGDASVLYGNLLTLPVGGRMLYLQPIYTQGSGNGSYPLLRFVAVSFGGDVGIGPTLQEALADLGTGDDDTGTTGDGSGGTGTTTPGDAGTGGSGGTGGTGTGSGLPADAVALLQQADAKFKAADQALKNGDLTSYAQQVQQARDLVDQALTAAGRTSPSPSPSASASPGAKATPSPTPTLTPTAGPSSTPSP